LVGAKDPNQLLAKETTVSPKVLVVPPQVLEATTEIVQLPELVGVPEINPEELLILSPPGRLVADQKLGAWVAEGWKLKACPTRWFVLARVVIRGAKAR